MFLKLAGWWCVLGLLAAFRTPESVAGTKFLFSVAMRLRSHIITMMATVVPMFRFRVLTFQTKLNRVVCHEKILAGSVKV